ncbi:major facilitator superfamily domain-containing protein [Cadophora sp. MPI-SDFR-AT-0126]|nr:major facilitator superfamily domain-containing protein [Leotiomycetes sp. MPI-SDFR-AT-0126]
MEKKQPSFGPKANKRAEVKTSSSDNRHKASKEARQTEANGLEYPTGLRLAFIVLGLCLAVFVVALDNTIIATAIPKITSQFNSLNDVGWYASAYLLTTGCFQLLYGRLYSAFRIKWVFISTIIIFELGSFVCGATPSSVGLIVGRAIAGVGAAGIYSGALIILANIVPLQKRPVYLGAIAGMYGLASVAGPLLGGVFTDKITWRLCFYINLPVGLITILAVVFFYHQSDRPTVAMGWRARLKTFNITGNVFLMPAVICLLLALQWGGTTYPWRSVRIIAMFAVFAILIIGFTVVQFLQPENAMVPPRLLRKRSIWAACIYSFTISGAFFILSYYLSIWFQAVKGSSAVKSGIMSLPFVSGVVLGALIAGIGTMMLGYYTPFMILSSILMPIGCGIITTFTPSTASPAWIGWLAMAGMGNGIGTQGPLVAVQNVLSLKDVPIGTALVVFMQTIGGAIAVPIGQTIFNNKLVEGLHKLTPELDPPSVVNIGATEIHNVFEGAQYTRIIEAYNDALSRTFLVATVLAALTLGGSLAMEWKTVKREKKSNENAEEAVEAEGRREKA